MFFEVDQFLAKIFCWLGSYPFFLHACLEALLHCLFPWGCKDAVPDLVGLENVVQLLNNVFLRSIKLFKLFYFGNQIQKCNPCYYPGWESVTLRFFLSSSKDKNGTNCSKYYFLSLIFSSKITNTKFGVWNFFQVCYLDCLSFLILSPWAAAHCLLMAAYIEHPGKKSVFGQCSASSWLLPKKGGDLSNMILKAYIICENHCLL